MLYFIYWISVVFIFVILLFLFWYIYIFVKWLFVKDVPYVNSFNFQLKSFLESDFSFRKKSLLVDLWCWDWKAMRFFSKNYKNIDKIDWYEIKRFPVIYWKIINKIFWYSKINFFRISLEKSNIKKYDYVYLYLFPFFLEKIENWIFSNIKNWAIIISNSFKFKKHKFFDTIKDSKWKDVFFLYKK